MTKATEATENELNLAQAGNALSESKLFDSQRLLLEAEGRRGSDKDAFDGSQDYRHGYVPFAAEISSDSVAVLTHNLRRISRLRPGKPIVIELNSPGGEITAGFQLFDEIVRLRKDGHKVTIRVRGNAASMAAIVLQAADVREVGPSAFVMIHRALFGAAGKAFEVEDTIELVKMLEAKFIDILVDRSKQPREVFAKLLDARKDQWFTAEQAVALGIADAVA